MKIMHHTFLIFAVTMMLTVAVAWSGEPAIVYTPEQILAKSIAYHDPNGVWTTARIDLGVHTVYSEEFARKAGSKEANLQITLAPGHEEFRYFKDTGTDKIEISLNRGQSSLTLNGSAEVSDEDKERLRIREAVLYRDYCEYLYLMPMKLRDPGTIVDPRSSSVRFNGRKVWQLKVTYNPEVGEDTWYFYFDHDTFALVGYRFYHDESKNDGEYITLEDEIVDASSGLRLPRTRAWYYNADDGHLATDDIVSISTSSN